MFDQRLIEALRANARAPKASQNGRARRVGDRLVLDDVPEQPRQKDFLTDQISTGGGIGGALGGAAAGAALGSVVPIVGTGIGGILGALIGGGLGSGAGEMTENAITGEKDLWKNVGQEALIGGATSLPIGAGLKLARAGVKATTGVGKKAAGELVQEAGVQTIGKRTVAKGGRLGTTFDDASMSALERLGAGKAVDGATRPSLMQTLANKSYAQAFTVPSKLAARLKPEKTAKELMDYGIGGSIDKIQATSKAAMQEVGRLFDDSIDGVNGLVKVGDPTGVMNNALKGVAISNQEKKAIRDLVTDIGTTSRMPGYETPGVLMEKVRDLGSRGYKMIDAGSSRMNPRPDLENLGRAYIQVADELEDQVYRAIQETGTLAARQTPENAARLNSVVKGLGDKFLAAKSGKEVRSLMAPFKRASDLADITTDSQQSIMTKGLGQLGPGIGGAGVGGLVGGIPGAALGFLAAPVVRSVGEAVEAPLATAVGRGINKLAGSGTSQVAAKTIGQGLPGLTARQGTGRGILGALTGEQVTQQTPEDLQALQVSLGGQQGTALTDTQLPQAEEPSIGGLTKTDLESLMVQAMQQGDSGGFTRFKQLYDMLPTPGETDLSAAQEKAMFQAANGENAISQLETLLQEAGGGSGDFVGGLRNMLPGQLDPAGKLYNDRLGGVVDQIAKAQGKTDALSEVDRDLIMQSLPRLTDTPENAARKIAILKQSLQTARQNALTGGGAY